jgi:hypothetical protein
VHFTVELPAPANRSPQLVAFPASEEKEDDVRDLALQNTIQSGCCAKRWSKRQTIREVLSALAYFEQKRGKNKVARER